MMNCPLDINKLTGEEEISIMRWRASQPFGVRVPLNLQFCRNYKIGFCGDWFDMDSCVGVESAMNSSIRLAKLLNWN